MKQMDGPVFQAKLVLMSVLKQHSGYLFSKLLAIYEIIHTYLSRKNSSCYCLPTKYL